MVRPKSKMKLSHKIAAVLAVMILMAATASTEAYAVEQVEYVNIQVDETKQDPGIVWRAEPSVYGTDYEIENFEWSRDYEKWEPGKKVTLTVYLASTDKSFARKPSVNSWSAELVSATRTDNTHLKIRLNYIPKVTLEAPSGICYEDEFQLTWDKVQYAGGYEVQIMKDGYYYTSVRLNGRASTAIDISQYATDDSLITVSVRAVEPEGKYAYIMASDWVNFDDEVIVNGNNTVYGQFSGSGEFKRFYEGDYWGNYSIGWQYINGVWYYFQPSDGYAVTSGWLADGGYWYFFDSEGRMLTGWQKDGGLWYYLNNGYGGEGIPYGAMRTGWITTAPSSPYYWLNDGSVEGLPYGAMLADAVTPDGYYVNASGEWRQ